MTTTTDLTVFKSGKVELGKNFLTVLQPLTDDEYKTYFHELLKFNDATNFWIGDLLLDLEAKKGSKVQLDFANLIECSSHHIENLRSFSKKYPRTKRVEGVSWSHHYDAYLECGKNEDVAKLWLEQSKQNKWSVREQRVQIREGLSSLRDKGTQIVNPSTQQNDVGYTSAIDGLMSVKRFLNNRNSKTPEQHIFDVVDLFQEVAEIIEEIT